MSNTRHTPYGVRPSTHPAWSLIINSKRDWNLGNINDIQWNRKIIILHLVSIALSLVFHLSTYNMYSTCLYNLLFKERLWTLTQFEAYSTQLYSLWTKQYKKCLDDSNVDILLEKISPGLPVEQTQKKRFKEMNKTKRIWQLSQFLSSFHTGWNQQEVYPYLPAIFSLKVWNIYIKWSEEGWGIYKWRFVTVLDALWILMNGSFWIISCGSSLRGI